MRRFDLVLTLSSVLALSLGCGSSSSKSSPDSGTTSDGSAADSATGSDGAAGDAAPAADAAGNDVGPSDVSMSADGATGDGGGADAAVLSAQAIRGKYLVGVLNCANCHTPKVPNTTMPDTTMTLAGVDCFVSTPGCLSSANLTPDMDTGLGAFSDQAIIDVLRTGKDPDPQAAGKYIFSRMPYYQFANLSDDDAKAIVAYLRALPAVKHDVKEATAPFDQAPSAPEWAPVDPAKLPAPGAGAPADAANGKYLASIMCVTCHSPDATGTPKHVDETTAFQGGQSATITSAGTMMMFQSANLTPDMTGIKGWTAADVVTAIKTAKDKMGKTLCAPMRANTAITDADATAIGDYLTSIPPVAHTVTACGARM
jgi:mono/diheme cytochrome c family protein